MEIKFTKMQGNGSDYIYINCFEQIVKSPEQLAVSLTDRHYSVGGDGLVLICPSHKTDAKIRIFNSDGSEGKMAGNVLCCVGKFLHDNKMVKADKVTVETRSGVKTLFLTFEDGEAVGARVDMGPAVLDPAEIPVTIENERVVRHPITMDGLDQYITCLSMGNPHCVLFVEDVENLELAKIGPKYENSPIFPDRINTEFVQVLDERTLRIRVWERGSGETLACGTGACAAVVAAELNGYCRQKEPITVKLRGGELQVQHTGETVYMTGPAQVVFRGTVTV